MIIGRGGCVIKEMQSRTRCRIQIPPTSADGIYRVISVSGPQAGCEQVKTMIDRIISEQSSQSVMTGAAFTNNSPYGGQGQQQPQQQNYYGQQQQGQQQYGQQQQQQYGQQQQAAQVQGQKSDYSAEWAAYYAAQAAAQNGGAAATATSVVASPTAATAAPAAAAEQPAHDAYYEVFWQYAGYYGEEAARKHYGAWSPPVGTPNPTGGAAVGGAVATPAPASAPAPSPQNVKDSSVRRVSNLPAWMNKS